MVHNLDLSKYNEGRWAPVGTIAGEAFNGTFDFNNYSVYNLNITGETYTYVDDYDPANPVEQTVDIINAGLFAELGEKALIKNLNLINPVIDGIYDYAGAIAGISAGKIEKTSIRGLELSNNNIDGVVGGVVGLLQVKDQDEFKQVREPKLSRVYIDSSFDALLTEKPSTIDTLSVAGGLVGINKGGTIVNSYALASILGDNDSLLGGLVADNNFVDITALKLNEEEDTRTYESKIKDCYFLGSFTSETQTQGALLGRNVEHDEIIYPNRIVGLYYSTEISGAVNGIAGIEDSTLPETMGIYNKTQVELQVQDTYHSYTDTVGAHIKWVFSRVWLMQEGFNGGYPYLNMETSAVSVIFQIIGVEGDINNINDLQAVRDNLGGDYTLRADLNLGGINDWTPIGSTLYPFTGTFAVADNHTISFVNITSQNFASGLFGINEGSITGLTLNNPNITAGKYVGAIAGINKGVIEDCIVDDLGNETPGVIQNLIEEDESVYETEAEKGSYVGGIAGKSDSDATIENCVNNVEVKPATMEGKLTAGGGLVGYNLGSVLGGHASATVREVGDEGAYIGGLVGYNESLIQGAYFLGDLFADINDDDTAVGGIAGMNDYGGKIQYCFAEQGTYEAGKIGGLVGITKGFVGESYVKAAMITGKEVGGLAFNVYDGAIENCHAASLLEGINSESITAGFAFFIDYENDDTHGTVSNCFSSTSFGDNGINYAETSAPIRTDLGVWVPRQAGYLEDSIFDSTNAGTTAIVQNFQAVLNWDIFIDDDEKAISVTFKHATGGDDKNFSIFDKHSFLDSIWLREVGNYMKLNKVENTRLGIYLYDPITGEPDAEQQAEADAEAEPEPEGEPEGE